MSDTSGFKLLVVGSSLGGMTALVQLLGRLPEDFFLPVVAVQHLAPSTESQLAEILNRHIALQVKEAEEKESISASTVYLAPPNYHLLVETDLTFTLTLDELVNYARPAIDVLFETAAEACGPAVIGIVMTGANSDGAKGLSHIKQKGGWTMVQEPSTAQSKAMPDAAVKTAKPDLVLPIDAITDWLLALHTTQKRRTLV
ncbi:chemotaxis protein CheB [Bowmanella denitrificans]|uniref:protein-glutamate methylesterase n=1 Tax=Bowmanella denitrificans TaxID=366582 RepID=A0ABN0XMK5_9ALTE